MEQLALHLVVDDPQSAIEIYERAFGAPTTRVLRLPGGAIATAALTIAGVPMAVASPVPGSVLATPASTGTTSAAFRLGVPDSSAAFDRAVGAGATPFAPVQDRFRGMRTVEVRLSRDEWMTY